MSIKAYFIIYEAVYFRPFNFRSSDPVRKGHAVQYVANPGCFGWGMGRMATGGICG